VATGTNYDCSTSDAVLGCVDSSGTKTCNCNTDLCNRGKGSRTHDFNFAAIVFMTLSTLVLSMKLI
jgi:hypothetical protein